MSVNARDPSRSMPFRMPWRERRAGNTRGPCRQLARSVQAGFEPDVGRRPEPVGLKIVFARVGELDGYAERFGDADSFGDISATAAAAESAAHIQRVEVDLVGRETAGLNRIAVGDAGKLAADPDFAGICFNVGNTRKGFHRRMREIGRFVNASICFADVASAASPSPRLRRDVARRWQWLSRECRGSAAVLRLAFSPSFHCTTSALRPSIAAHVLSATTAMPSGNLDDMLHARRRPLQPSHRSWQRNLPSPDTAQQRHRAFRAARTSSANSALPVIFSGVSRRFVGLPTTLNSDAGFSWIVFAAGAGEFRRGVGKTAIAQASHSLPY